MNISIFYLLYSFAHHYWWLDTLISFLAVPFIYIIIIVITFLYAKEKNLLNKYYLPLLKLIKKSKEVIWIIATTGITYIIANSLKNIIKTDRPFTALSNIHTLVKESGYAFPSGHSATIAAFAFAIYFRNKKLGRIALVAMVLIGLSRVAAGVHFPIDIIGGFALGFLVAFFTKSL